MGAHTLGRLRQEAHFQLTVSSMNYTVRLFKKKKFLLWFAIKICLKATDFKMTLRDRNIPFSIEQARHFQIYY